MLFMYDYLPHTALEFLYVCNGNVVKMEKMENFNDFRGIIFSGL